MVKQKYETNLEAIAQARASEEQGCGSTTIIGNAKPKIIGNDAAKVPQFE